MTHSCPWLLPLLAEHLQDQEGQVLPHLYMADVERWAEGEAVRSMAAPGSEIRQLLDFLEAEFACHSNTEIGEVISASFLEHLPRPGEPGAVLRSLVGPTCAARLELIG